MRSITDCIVFLIESCSSIRGNFLIKTLKPIMRHTILSVLIATLFTCSTPSINTNKTDAFKELAEKISSLESQFKQKTVAIFDFTIYDGLPNSEANFAAERLAQELAMIGKLKVIERTRLKSVVQEQELGQTGIVENGDAIKMGKIISAEAVIIGSVYNRSYGSVGMSKTYMVRVINSSTARIIYSGMCTDSSDVTKLASQNSKQNIIPDTVTASSYLVEPHLIHYPENTTDGIPSTTWVDGNSKKDAIGEWLRYSFNNEVTIKQLKILNGYIRISKIYGDLYYLNKSVKTIKFTYSNGKSDLIYLEHKKEWQTRNLNNANNISWLQLTIQDEFAGKKWNDTCISEVKFIGK